MHYQWDFSVIGDNAGLLLWGLGNTLLLTLIAILIGTPLGLAVALMRLSSRRWLVWPATVYVEVFRAAPALVQLYWLYFALPRLTGLRLGGFEAAAIALSILSSAFLSEVFRGGIASIGKGQWDAARGIGLSYPRMLRTIILPQAIRRMLPVFLERYIELLKTSTIAATVSFGDLLFVAQDISYRTYRTLEIFSAIAVMFFLVILLCSQLTRLVEHRLARSGEFTAR
ncbi:amino acid ABC transporter permease [Ancylobacter sonchi]|uniref:amino acid ABC transporter permease n=1 Tax=Ancylobacter sonchi TaxID=1937790 RepID=UPI001BD56118|nr:amino acid ABC transporter permease [Ancylobacter sonchi]MBS7532520.1 amino acid ABC transporter permease [Ancylobacter sonchi]